MKASMLSGGDVIAGLQSGFVSPSNVSAEFVHKLETHDVSVLFDGLKALESITISLEQNEILGLLGPNGAGKTTLVNVMSGYLRPTHGSLLLDNVTVNRLPPEELAHRGVARTFQSVRLFRRLTVFENVEAAALTRHARRGAARDAAQEALSYVGLEEVAQRRADALPYAHERRVGIARALALEPRFLLLDEPAAGMTELECDELARLIQQLPSKFGCGVLLIEHNMGVVMTVCQRLHVLNNGRTLATGPSEIVRRDPEVIDAYLGAA
ncbi:ABC transporter ATP-binding protein [Neoaquamicrobium sediminum]|uniref:ABC transporter ATP-binding protein n=2 Tax=Neoaquamicrobium sediminum TaxID=1849104 RepID=UPI00362236A5